MRLVTTSPRVRDAEHTLPAERLAQLLDLLLALNLFVFTPTCWKRAPILQRYLALNGVATHIMFGVRKSDRELLAGHAWLERDGRPIFETNPPDYLVTYTYP
jgi:Transglutaminase-like superfamily